MRWYKNNGGFTLIEIMVVLVVIGVMVALAMPRYQTAVEKVRSAEGVNILDALLGAQKRYSLENAGAYTSNINNLDITIPASNFSPPTFNLPTVATANPIATIDRNGGSYRLTITDTGTVACVNPGGGAVPLICTKMGY